MAVIRTIVQRPLALLHPLYAATAGQYGYTAVQGNPRRNNDLAAILTEAESLHDLGENVIVKLPATPVGVLAMEELTARGWPTIGTMSFSVAQYISMAEAHERGLKRTKLRPRCLITMLPGLFDEYLIEYSAAAHGICDFHRHRAACRHQYSCRAAHAIYRDRGPAAQAGTDGARSALHWTEVVGPGMGITLGGALADRHREKPSADCVSGSAPPRRQKFSQNCRIDFLIFVSTYDPN